jgi:hypothetical protein
MGCLPLSPVFFLEVFEDDFPSRKIGIRLDLRGKAGK